MPNHDHEAALQKACDEGALVLIYDKENGEPVVALRANATFKFYQSDTQVLARALAAIAAEAQEVQQKLASLRAQKHYLDLLLGAVAARIPEAEMEQAATEREAEESGVNVFNTTGRA